MFSARHVVILLYLFFSAPLSAQQDADDLLRWQGALNDPAVPASDKTWYADSALLYYRKINADSALLYAGLVLHYATQTNDTASIDYAHVYLGSLYRKLGSYDSSLFYYNKAMASYRERNFEEGIASVYNNIATVYTTQNRYDLAIQNYHEALSVFSASENYTARANIYSNFAELYYKLENYEKAYEYWSIAQSEYMKSEVAYQLTHSFRGLAKIYIQRGELDSAHFEIDKALELDRRNGVPVFEVEDLLLKMRLANIIGASQQLISTGDTVRHLLSIIDLPEAWANYYELRGDQPELFRDPARSIAYYDSCLVFLDVEEVPEDRLRVLKNRFRMNLSGGMDFNGYNDYMEIVQLESVVSSLRRDRVTQEMDASYNLKASEEMIRVLNEKNKTAEELVRKEQELKQRNEQQILFLWIGILAICAFVVYGVIIYRRLRSTKKELEKSVDQKDFLFRELNHRVKNNLAIVNSFLGIEMHGRPEEVQEILKACEGRIHSLGLMHEMLYRGDTSGSIDLETYLERLVEFVKQSLVNDPTRIEIRQEIPVQLPSDKIVLLGLVVNELLTNAMKYAKHPSRDLQVVLEVTVHEKQITLTVQDNGVGLKPDFNPQQSASLGMKLAYGLTRQLGGKFSFANLPEGSCFTIQFVTTNF